MESEITLEEYLDLGEITARRNYDTNTTNKKTTRW